jgi:hypothetical protein
VRGYADVYDADAFEACAGARRSFLYTCNDSAPPDKLERFYRAIFGGGYKLRLCAAYKASLQNGVRPQKDYVFPPELADCLPNPHIQRYGCIGSYAERFQAYMHRRDYVGAIDQAILSARNLNFHDSAVMGSLVSELASTRVKCVETPDGRLLTPEQAINELEDLACQDLSA